MNPKLITGGNHKDERGQLTFNNAFCAKEIKRLYTIENKDTDFVRAWQGHRVERRWFMAISGAFEIKLIQVENWESPAKDLTPEIFQLKEENMDVLALPAGYISSIQALTKNAKLLVMADYAIGETNDEYRYDKNYFYLVI